MAVMSSSYHFPSALPFMGLVPPPPQLPGHPPSNFPMVGFRLPPYLQGAYLAGPAGTSLQSFAHNSAFFRLSSEQGAKASVPVRKLTYGAISSFKSQTNSRNCNKVVDFSIDGILGTSRTLDRCSIVNHNARHQEEEDIICKDEQEKDLGAESDQICENSSKTDAEERENPMARFSWLQCTRYKPPRLPRTKRKDASKKRKLGRNPRVPFSPAQVATLEQKFRCTHYLSSYDVAELSSALNLSENRVKIWFQNRRARERRDKDAAEKNYNPTIIPASPPLSNAAVLSQTSTPPLPIQSSHASPFSPQTSATSPSALLHPSSSPLTISTTAKLAPIFAFAGMTNSPDMRQSMMEHPCTNDSATTLLRSHLLASSPYPSSPESIHVDRSPKEKRE